MLIVIVRRRRSTAVGATEQLGRSDHAVIVQERLAHPHEDRPGDPPALRAGEVAGLDPLVDDLPGRQVPPDRHPGRGAERAAHGAADLRREADAHRPGLCRGMSTVSTASPSRGQETELLKAVARRRDDAVEGQSREVADRSLSRFGTWNARPQAAGSWMPLADHGRESRRTARPRPEALRKGRKASGDWSRGSSTCVIRRSGKISRSVRRIAIIGNAQYRGRGPSFRMDVARTHRRW